MKSKLVHVIIDSKKKLWIELAFQEALANSLEHGNLELESKWREVIDETGIDRFSKLKAERLKVSPYCDRLIKVRMEFAPGRLQIQITDQGPGFDPKSTPTLPEDQLLSSGRGRALIESTMTEVRYEDGGRTIVMIKLLGSGGK